MGWQIKGNIKGADGTAIIPDPLVVDNVLYVGDSFRVTKLTHGGKVEVKDPSDNWHTQAEWKEDT